MPSVLIVEDDDVLAGLMRRHLAEAGFAVEWAEDGERALRKIRFERPDLCVVDLMLPGIDGWRLIETLRAEGDATPIVVLSARSSEHDKVHTLGIGADDSLVKPASMRELVARVQANLRRARAPVQPVEEQPLAFPGLELDPRLHRARVQDAADGPWRDAGLTVKEFRLLWTLAADPGRAMRREELQQRVWGVPYRPRDRSVDVCVRKIREKIDERACRTYIQTHYGIGYRFDPTEREDGWVADHSSPSAPA